MRASKEELIAQLQSMVQAIEASDPASRGTGWLSEDSEPASRGRGKRKTRNEQKELPPDKAAYQRVVDLCGYHEFCSAKMRTRLLREGIPAQYADEAIAKAMRIGLIDDLRWGEMRASALMRKGMGNSGIVRELKENGISASAISGWPYEYEERFGNEYDRAMEVLEKNPPRSKNLRGAAYGKLMRKGYGPSIAAQVSAAWYARVCAK